MEETAKEVAKESKAGKEVVKYKSEAVEPEPKDHLKWENEKGSKNQFYGCDC